MSELTTTNCKKGDIVTCINNVGIPELIKVGEQYILEGPPYRDDKGDFVVNLLGAGVKRAERFKLIKTNKTKMKDGLNSVKTEVSEFIESNKNTLYWVAILVVVDQFFLEGKFREKLKEIFESLVEKVKEKLDTIHI